ncbi:tRNA-dihydrouridine(16/17) synthase [Phlyctema vagabunda]|uniref:tRNA-dihydrouridine(16/17) synthase [NAD(P)(+)] n=1 Tax=Phlyctema vagabunda TaxID=108571 RepID=A0ABR4P834_9HELO
MTISNEGVTTQPATTISQVENGEPAMPGKLHGRAFYESIGSPKFVLAPMVDQSEFAWRMLSRSFMTPSSNKDLVAYTPMLHARMFTETPKFRDAHFQPTRNSLATPLSSPPASDIFLDGHPQLDRPLFVQFCANDPDELLEAARYVAPFCDAVDLNLGCPQGIARKGKYGAFLQEDQELIYSLINKLHQNLLVPVTAKIRILESKEKTLAYAKKVLDAGASILTVHGRHRDQKGHKTGLADWKMIRFLRDNLPKETVLFANGNILNRQDITRCIEATGADGVMSAEGNLYDPAIFSEAPAVGEEGREFWRGRDGKGGWRMDAALRRYMDIIYKYVLEVPLPDRKPLYLPSDVIEEVKAEEAEEESEGPPKKKQRTLERREKKERVTSPNLIAMQPHLFRLLRPLVAKHHPIRDALAKSRAGDVAAFENVLQMVEKAVAVGLKEYEDTNGESWQSELDHDERLAKLKETESRDPDADGDRDEEYESSLDTVKACKRPWWVVQPYVRPLAREALMKGSLTLSKKEKAKLEEEERKARGEETKLAGHTELETVGPSRDGGNQKAAREEIEIPKDGLVCG